MATDLAKLIEEEESAMKALDDAKKRADEAVEEARTKAKAILAAASDVSAFGAFVEERSRQIEESRKDVIDRADARGKKLAELAERNLDRAVDMALKKVLGLEI